MKAAFICLTLMVSGILLTGCSNERVQPAQSAHDQPSPRNLTLQEAQAKVGFKILMPSTTLFGLTFNGATVVVNPNGESNQVNLVFSSIDKKRKLVVNEREGASIGKLGGSVTEESINGLEAKYAKGDQLSALLWTNGKVVCYAVASSNSDISTRQALVSIAKSFK